MVLKGVGGALMVKVSGVYTDEQVKLKIDFKFMVTVLLLRFRMLKFSTTVVVLLYDLFIISDIFRQFIASRFLLSAS